jgi:hypothetical protein
MERMSDIYKLILGVVVAVTGWILTRIIGHGERLIALETNMKNQQDILIEIRDSLKGKEDKS